VWKEEVARKGRKGAKEEKIKEEGAQEEKITEKRWAGEKKTRVRQKGEEKKVKIEREEEGEQQNKQGAGVKVEKKNRMVRLKKEGKDGERRGEEERRWTEVRGKVGDARDIVRRMVRKDAWVKSQMIKRNKKWREEGKGFEVEGGGRLTHFVWADNVYILGNKEEEVKNMFQEVTE
jgi:hypothetical protein